MRYQTGFVEKDHTAKTQHDLFSVGVSLALYKLNKLKNEADRHFV